jgi:hypothetical protein
MGMRMCKWENIGLTMTGSRISTGLDTRQLKLLPAGTAEINFKPVWHDLSAYSENNIYLGLGLPGLAGLAFLKPELGKSLNQLTIFKVQIQGW